MARLILKSPYLKPGGIKSPGGYLKYIATREGVEMAEDTSRHLPATAEQQKQIKSLIKKHPQSKESHEYEDYLASPTRGNADAFLWNICEEYQDGPKRDVYLKYIDERPGSNGLFTDEGVPIVLSQVQKEMNEHPGNIWTHIISLRREDAERLGYNNPDAWMHLLRSQRNMIAQQMKIAPEKQYLKTDIQKAISMFELAAEQGNSYAEYQLGKIYCFGQGVPQNLEVGMEWLKASASHGNEYASALLEKVQNHIHHQTTSAVFGLFRGLAGMIQNSANNFIRRRNSIDRKQRQKIEEKKQAHGQRSSGYEYDYNEEQTM